LDQQKKPRDRGYLSVQAVMFGLAIVGPLALPLLWFSPKFSLRMKILMTTVTALLTIWLFKSSIFILQAVLSQMKDLKEISGAPFSAAQ